MGMSLNNTYVVTLVTLVFSMSALSAENQNKELTSVTKFLVSEMVKTDYPFTQKLVKSLKKGKWIKKENLYSCDNLDLSKVNKLNDKAGRYYLLRSDWRPSKHSKGVLSHAVWIEIMPNDKLVVRKDVVWLNM